MVIRENKIFQEESFEVFKHNDLICVVYRAIPSLGHLNGYVGIPKMHWAYGKHYDEIEDIEVHGGLTYSSHRLSCIDESVFGEMWWFGFDTAHAGDKRVMTPEDTMYFYLNDNDVYRDFNYVKQQVIGMADYFTNSIQE